MTHEENKEPGYLELLSRVKFFESILDFGVPWESRKLREWSIVGMNHYHVKGERYLFVAMAKENRMIKAEGTCAKSVFNCLEAQA